MELFFAEPGSAPRGKIHPQPAIFGLFPEQGGKLVKGRIAAGYPAPSRAWRPCKISACSCSVMNVLSSVNSLSRPVPPPRPRLEKMGIPARLKASRSLWMVLTETEQCSASSFAVPHEPLMSKKRFEKGVQHAWKTTPEKALSPEKLCGGLRSNAFSINEGVGLE